MELTLLFEIITAVAVCALTAAVVYSTHAAVKTPVPNSEDLQIWVVIAAENAGGKLEQTVKSVLWLKESGTLRCTAVIADMGLEPEPRRMAELMSKNGDCVLCRANELPDMLEGTK